MKDPAFLLYSKDFASGTTHMSPCEVGVYLRLLLHQHQHGSIPQHTEKLMRIAGVFHADQWNQIWETVSEKFILVNQMVNQNDNQTCNQMVNQRLATEMTKRQAKNWKKVAAATLAGHLSAAKNLSESDRIQIKNAFDINVYRGLAEKEIKSKIRIWFNRELNQMVNHLVNNNANANANVIEDESKFLKRGYGGKTFAEPQENSDWEKMSSPVEALRSPVHALRFSQLIEKDQDIQKLPGQLDFFLKKWESSMMFRENFQDEWRTMSWTKLAGSARRYLLSIVQSEIQSGDSEKHSLDLSSANL